MFKKNHHDPLLTHHGTKIQFLGPAGDLPSDCGPREASEYPLSQRDPKTATLSLYLACGLVRLGEVREEGTRARFLWARGMPVDEL